MANSNETSEVRDIEAILASLRQRVMVIVFIIDVSGSMKGVRIEAVNYAIRGVLPHIVRKERENVTETRLAVMEFSGAAQWRTLTPEPASSFRYEITDTGGGANYSKAFKALNEKLSWGEFLSASDEVYAPVILMLTDGKPSDPALYKEELVSLSTNPWFVSASKVGIAIAEGAESPECQQALTEFTGSGSMVFMVRDVQTLGRYIRGAVIAGIDASLKRGVLMNERRHRETTRPVLPFYASPVEAAGGEIPGLEEIDWEREFL
ncbi:MAG: VWA domain-containing protein [Synergistaceae bacterium]|jgi:uncharacterized protein YegL|nr:VWA domain-containing protein [Synergistaceae bacterium]